MTYNDEKYVIRVTCIRDLLENTFSAHPREASGILIKEKCKKFTILSVYFTGYIDNTPVSFRIKDKEIRQIKEFLQLSNKEVCGCFHSHIFGSARPSKYDCAGQKIKGELWLIYSSKFHELKLFEWQNNDFAKKRFVILQ